MNEYELIAYRRTLGQIALQKLGVETLETRDSDFLDFHEVSVRGLKEALEAAYEAGRRSAEMQARRVMEIKGGAEND